jgi:hypothetical protein
MSFFITASNQEMLWRTIQKNSLFDSTLTTEQQPIWFREIIGNIYSENINKKLDNNDLLELNKSTLRFMIHSLKGRITREPTFIESINDRLEPKSTSYQSNYDNLQNNYDDMHKRIIPQEPNFKEKLDDDKIQNIEELIQQQLRERELEMPKPPVELSIKNQVIKHSIITGVKDIYVQTDNDITNELNVQIQTLLIRTDNLEQEMKFLRSQITKYEIIHQSQDDPTLSL